MNYDLRLQDNLKKLIAERRLTLNKIAKKVGVNKSTLHNYINGVTPQGIETLLKLAGFFEISLNDLLFDRDRETSDLSLKEGHYEIIIKKKK